MQAAAQGAIPEDPITPIPKYLEFLAKNEHTHS